MNLLFPLFALLTTTMAANLTTIHQFSNGTWLENIAPMHNGSLLVTVIGRAEVHMLDPTVSPATSKLLATFPAHNAALGITELSHDKFAVAVGNVTASNTPIAETWAVYTLDFSRDCKDEDKAKDNASGEDVEIQKVTDLPNISMINGMTTLNPHTLLLADSWAGNIVSLNTLTKQSSIFLSHTILRPDFDNKVLPLGVNGVRVHKDYVYFTNTVLNHLGRVRISPTGPTGPFEMIAQGTAISQPDDFAVAQDGSVYLARPLGDTIQHVSLDGTVREIVKGGLGSGATSVVFGKGGEETLYLSESGLEGGVMGHGGRVIRVEL